MFKVSRLSHNRIFKMNFSASLMKIIFIILFLSHNIVALHSEHNPETVEMLYIEAFAHWSFRSLILRSPESHDVCNFVKEEKMAVCEMIFRQDHYSRININLGKTAIYFENAECEEKELTFYFKTDYNKKLTRKMFPCYGAHNPIRTNWDIDDYFDAYYVSQGPNHNSLFVYARKKNFLSSILNSNLHINYYSPIEYLTNVDIANLVPIDVVYYEDYVKELKSRKFITFNGSIEENNINYVLEINNEKRESNLICNLEKKMKIQLCERILNRNPYQNVFKLNNVAMQINATECEYEEILCTQFELYNLVSNVQRHKMYPCYGQHTIQEISQFDSVLYLAEGYRDNSVLVLRKNTNDNSKYDIVEFAENVFFTFCSLTMQSQVNITENENLYIKTIGLIENQTNILCHLSKAKKLGICEALLLQPYYKNTSETFFSKTAAYFLTPDCIESSITFRDIDHLNENIPKQRMFPCYARSNPMRTDWIIDDKFDRFFISGGPETDSLIVYRKYKEILEDKYMITEIMWDVGIENIFPNTISRDEVDTELKLLEIVSCNNFTYEIETAFLREIVQNYLETLNTICQFETEKKLLLCKTIITQCYHLEVNVRNDIDLEPLNCVQKTVHFMYKTNNTDVIVEVFPCHLNWFYEKQNDDPVIFEYETDSNRSSDGGNSNLGLSYPDEIGSTTENEDNEEEILSEELYERKNPNTSEEQLDTANINQNLKKLFYVSTGFRLNSVLVYTEPLANNDNVSSQGNLLGIINERIDGDKIIIHRFVENLNFEYSKSTSTVEEMPTSD